MSDDSPDDATREEGRSLRGASPDPKPLSPSMAHKHEMEKTAAEDRRWMNRIYARTGVGVTAAIVATCFGILVSPWSSETLKADALKGLLGLGIAFGGFMAGKVAAKAE